MVVFPLLDQLSTSNIIDGQYGYGVTLFVMIAGFECVSNLHLIYYLEPNKATFSHEVHRSCERYSLSFMEHISHACQRKLLDGDISQKTRFYKWQLKAFVMQIIDSTIAFIPILGYLLWIAYRSPFTVLTYIVSIYMYIRYVEAPTIDIDEYNKVWDKYNSFKNNEYSDLIHARGPNCHDKMADCMFDFESVHSTNNYLETKYSQNIHYS